jgi:GNAT superfamily N-acetyltransferase
MELWIPQLTFSPAYFVANESWVAELEHTPIGWCSLDVRNGQAWLENMWVLPEYIGRSVGKQLFIHIVELARQRGYQVLRLEAEPNAVGFYEKMGMQKIGEYRYQLDGQPRILPLMELKI